METRQANMSEHRLGIYRPKVRNLSQGTDYRQGLGSIIETVDGHSIGKELNTEKEYIINNEWKLDKEQNEIKARNRIEHRQRI